MLETIVREPEDGLALPSPQHTTGPLRLSRIALSAQRIQSNLMASEPADAMGNTQGRALHNSTVADTNHTKGPSALDPPDSQMAEDDGSPPDTTAIDLLKLLRNMRRPGYAQRYRRALDEACSVRQPPQNMYPGAVHFGLAADAHGLPYGGDIPEGYYWAVYQPETESAGVDLAGGLGHSPLASPVTTLEPLDSVDSSIQPTQSVASCLDHPMPVQQEDTVASPSTEAHDRIQDAQINSSAEVQGRIILRAPGFTLRGSRTPNDVPNGSVGSIGAPSGTQLSAHVTPGNSMVSPAANTKATAGLGVEGATSSRGVKRARAPSTSTSSSGGHSDSDDPDTESSHTSATSSFSTDSKRVIITLNPARAAGSHGTQHEGAFICGLDGCQIEYASLEPLLRHQTTSVLHAGRNYHCEVCGNCYSRSDGLKRHQLEKGHMTTTNKRRKTSESGYAPVKISQRTRRQAIASVADTPAQSTAVA